ncbi:class I SAM-dependent DNA methyltransferase [Flagellimonas sediminis]|uniref:Methyltransferase domain-containing protein n=1 Tax=Flagellimonas sediminis TaxID=2696468 RepID=A0A6I5KNX2_9FLAO|nr:class I SAM-dependent methyltransferase [Allomuricauda sediminis]NDV42386.1 methyltransferase domain-containing protein [Allomuricauda sediminis]
MIQGGKKHKNNSEISKEWDAIAKARSQQLLRHEDISMDKVLIPMLLNMTSDSNFSNVIDLGCGTGYSTKHFHEKSKKLTGIDISTLSIKEAKSISPEINFVANSIEDYSKMTTEKYTLAISNMTFMDVTNLEKVIKSTSDILKLNAHLVLTITHPYFWPLYWGYEKYDWFNYSKEIEIEANFNISFNSSPFITTHYHRPLETYINLLKKYNLQIIEMREPMPETEIMNEYPSKWKYPRFVGMKCIKTG